MTKTPPGSTTTVLVMRCERYDRAAIRAIVANGIRALGYAPSGKVFVKPNVVFAGKPEVYGTHAFTRPALVGACALALAASPAVGRVDIGETSAIGFPTRRRLQNRLGNPACLSTAFAVWRDLTLPSTGKRMAVIGLNQISWSPLPCRSKRQPASRSRRRSSGPRSAITPRFDEWSRTGA
jgi:hypothetical protein